jgi:6-phosphogluconolactonase
MGAAEPVWHVFPAPGDLAEALAGRIADALSAALSRRGQATLAVSGGRTPVGLFRALSRKRLDWPKVIVTLVDERFVPPDDARSNAKLVRENLRTGEAARLTFVPLYRPTETIAEAAQAAGFSIAGLPKPFDVVVLGMGADGHTASFFPDAPDLAALLENRERRHVLPVVAESAGEPRLTLPMQTICAARLLVLHIEGEDKRQVLTAALATRDKPVSAVFDHARDGVQIYWAP